MQDINVFRHGVPEASLKSIQHLVTRGDAAVHLITRGDAAVHHHGLVHYPCTQRQIPGMAGMAGLAGLALLLSAASPDSGVAIESIQVRLQV